MDRPEGVHLEVVVLVLDVLHQAGRHDVDRRLVPQLLDDLVDHPAQLGRRPLEQLRDREEQLDDLVLAEVLALVQQVNQLREQTLALTCIDLVIVEAPGRQNHLRLEDLRGRFVLPVVPKVVLPRLHHRLHHVHVVHFKH